jgi:pSer/pThr/pTyr-binding forkhead associated (FHA) protein
MPICLHCGREARPLDRYCQVCGQELPQPDGNFAQLGGVDAQPAFGFASSHPGVPDSAEAAAPRLYRAGAPATVATSVAQARVIVRSASDNESGDRRDEREFSLDGRDLAIGRAPSCDIVLSGDQLASRRHALLRNKGRHYSIVDLGSSNGTYVNDLEIREETVLHDGDCIKVGGHELIYQLGPAGPNASLPGAEAVSQGPQSPLLETTPSIASISMAGVAPADAPGAGPLSVPDEIRRADEAFIIAQAAGPASEQRDPPPPEPLGEMPAMPAPRTPLSVQPGGPTGLLDSLRTQLAEASAALAAQAEVEAQAADHLRVAVGDIRDRLDDLMRTLAAQSTDIDDLVTIARQAAENPRHLDYVAMLADHAGAIADALEQRQPFEARNETRAALAELRARMDDLLS